MKRYFVIAIIILACSSCEKKVLFKDPYYTTNLVNVIVDPDNAEKALNGAYGGLFHIGFYDLEEINGQWSGALVSPNYGSPEEIISTELKFRASSFSVDNAWAACFTLVNNSNWVLQEVPKISDDLFKDKTRKNQILAEARFLRAMGNSMCLLNFGYWFDLESKYGVPLRTQLTTKYSGLDIARSSVSACYDSIFADLDFAIANLRTFSQIPANTGYNYTKKAVACVNVAKALKAKMLMNRGLPADLDQVISLTSDVIKDNVNYKLQAGPATVFKGGISEESILLNYPIIQNTSPRLRYSSDDNGYYAYTAGTVLNGFINDPRFTGQNDKRITHDPYVQDKGYYSVTDVRRRIIKYNDYSYREQIYFIRLSEMYLLKAEAHAKKNELELAKTALNAIWNQAGGINPVPLDYSTKEKMMDLILREYYVELSVEVGQDWNFLVRNNMVKNYRPNTRIKGKEFYILPIPYNEVMNNG